MILEERYPQYRFGLIRKPLATMGYHAFGKPMSTLLSTTMYFGKTGGAAIYLMVAASMLQSILAPYLPMSLCMWTPTVAAIIWIPLWLRSLADFWPISYLAVGSAALTAVIVVFELVKLILSEGITFNFTHPEWESYAGAYGLLLFAFGGAGAFPNIQIDMKKRKYFGYAAMTGMTTLFLIYVPTAVLAYMAFGSTTSGNVLNNLPGDEGLVKTTLQICMLIHSFSVIFLNINPVFLDLEEMLSVPKKFTIKRCLLRTAVLGVALLAAEVVPSFGAIQALLGGTCFSIMLTAPTLNYIKLSYDRTDANWPKRSPLPVYQLVAIGVVSIAGLTGGVLTTYLNLKNFTFKDSVCFAS